MKITTKKLNESKVEVMGRMVSKEEADDMTIEMVLADFSSALNFLKRKGVDRRIINDTIINGMDYRDLNFLCSDIDSWLRGKQY